MSSDTRSTSRCTLPPPPACTSSSSSCPFDPPTSQHEIARRLNPLIKTSSTTKAEGLGIARTLSFGSSSGRAGGGASELEKEEVTLQLILQGQTKSPIGIEDLRGWLAHRESSERASADEEAAGGGDRVVLEWLVAFERYRSTFFALPLDEQRRSPTVFELVSLFSLATASDHHTEKATLPALPPSAYQPSTPTSSADGATSGPSTPRSAFTSPSISSRRLSQPLQSPAHPSRSRSGSEPPPLAFVPEGLALPARPRPVGSASSSDGRSVRSGSSRRTAGGLRGLGQRPLPRAHEEEQSEEDYAEEVPETRSASSRQSKTRPTRRPRGTGSPLSIDGSTFGSSCPYPPVPRPPLSRPRAATLPTSSSNPFSGPLSLADDPSPSPLFSKAPTPPPHDYDVKPSQAQPLREELDALLSLAKRLPALLHVTDQTRREAQMTTHPDVLKDLATKVEAWAEREWLTGTGGFFEDALQNLDRMTALGRLLCGSFLSILAVVALFLLLLRPSPFRSDGNAVPRAWRLIVVPMFLGGVGYAMGSRKSLCFWLALFGVRESRDFETAPSIQMGGSASTRSRRPSASLRGRHVRPLDSSSQRDHGPPLNIFTTQTLSPHDLHFPYTSSNLSLAPSSTSTTHRPLLPTKLRTHGGLPSRTLWKLRLKLRPVKVKWSPWFISIWRLTGTAWGTRRVEDERVIRAQRKAAWRIASGLGVVMVVLTVVVMSVPDIKR